MLQFTNAVPDRSRPAVYTANEAVMKGGDPESYLFCWAASARASTTGISNQPNPHDEATRTATTVFVRGLKERIEITTNNGLPWQWRRIVFAQKGMWNDITQTSTFQLSSLTSSGYRRLVNEAWGTSRSFLTNYLFRGVVGNDWNDEINAPIDTRRVTVLYDKTRAISSGNERGVMRTYKLWHGINKNLVYDDDENGGAEDSSAFSVSSKAGIGDIYVIDIFRPRGGSVPGDQLAFGPSATLYWHER